MRDERTVRCHDIVFHRKGSGVPLGGSVEAEDAVSGGMRVRWKDDQGRIYEWDYRHGGVEAYDPRGRHLGEFDPNTGLRTKPPDPARTIQP